MKLTIKLEKPKATKTVRFSKKKVSELLLQLNINPQTVIVIRKERGKHQVITEDENLKDGDYLELLSVVSGG